MPRQAKGSIERASLAGRAVDLLAYFSWWIDLQQRVSAWPKDRRYGLVGSAIVLGILARLWAQTLPGNWDFGQWINVSAAVLDGRDPYAEFGYNYPLPWLMTLAGFNAVTSTPEAFRLLISVLLTAADVGIVLLLARRGYALAGCLFMLSPVTIAISGQHQQVEGITVFLALAAVTLLSRPTDAESQDSITWRDWVAAFLLGLSLAFKPVFLLLPLWLAMRPGVWQRRLFHLVAPVGVFGVIFVTAFALYPPGEVLQKVLGHGGANNSPFINAFVPSQLAPWVLEHGGGKAAFLAILLAAGWYFRRLPAFELTLAYTVSAVLFSWAVVNQYLVTPMAAIAIFMNIGFLAWFILTVVYLGGDVGVLNLWGLRSIQPHVLLEWERVMQDLFPWLLIGWVLFAVAIRREGRVFLSESAQDELRRGLRDNAVGPFRS